MPKIVDGEKIVKCGDVKIGSHFEEVKEWTPYSIGDELYAGTYEVKLEGKKKPSRTVDWIIKTNGQWLDEWAVWTKELNEDLITYYKLDETSGTVVIDSVGNNPGTSLDVTVNQVGLLGTSYDFGGNGNITTGIPNVTSISLWINGSNSDNFGIIASQRTVNGWKLLRASSTNFAGITIGGTNFEDTTVNR